jgi:hypothetical protein
VVVPKLRSWSQIRIVEKRTRRHRLPDVGQTMRTGEYLGRLCRRSQVDQRHQSDAALIARYRREAQSFLDALSPFDDRPVQAFVRLDTELRARQDVEVIVIDLDGPGPNAVGVQLVRLSVIADVPCLLPRRRRRRRGLTFQAAHVFLLAPYELGPPLRRRCARICVIAAGPPRSLYATTRQSRRLSRPRHRRFGFSWAVPVGGRGHS